MSLLQGPRILILLMLVSFPAVCAVLFTPALPELAEYFHIQNSLAQATMSIFLVGYAIGQLPYAPIANRYGRKKTIYIGLSLALFGTFVCWIAPTIGWLLAGRFFQALGAAVGLKITFTMIGDSHTGAQSIKAISYVMLAFAIAPGLAVALGGILTDTFGWKSCFIFLTSYTAVLALLCLALPETASRLDKEALRFKTIKRNYWQQFSSPCLMYHALLIGLGTSVIYVFATCAPYIGINEMHLTPSLYGLLNVIPLFGLGLGQMLSSSLAGVLTPRKAMLWGIIIMSGGIFAMWVCFSLHWIVPSNLFIPQAILMIGNSLMFSNASSQGLSTSSDKAHAAAVLQFTNMSFAAINTYIASSWLPHAAIALPSIYLVIAALAFLFWWRLRKIRC